MAQSNVAQAVERLELEQKALNEALLRTRERQNKLQDDLEQEKQKEVQTRKELGAVNEALKGLEVIR